MALRGSTDRYSFASSDESEHLESFADAVLSGLRAETKSLPCRFLYDAIGSELFEEICDLEEYYLTRAEHSILDERADEIAALLPTPVQLTELGSGSSVKTRLLIEALLRHQDTLRYVPVDISPSILEDSSRSLLDTYAALEVHAIAAEYRSGIRQLHRKSDHPQLIAWLGSNVGNFDRNAATEFLGDVREAMGKQDHLLLGIDLRKDSRTLERAYDDESGVTARFNLNILARINRELGGSFDLDAFEHRARYHEQEGRVKIDLVSLRDQTAKIDALDLEVSFAAGEAIHTEDSFKYSVEEIDALAASVGMRADKHWFDARSDFSLNLFSPA